MNPVDKSICRDVLTVIRSEKYSTINYLFQEAVDTNFFPTYTTLVRRPMDLGTAEKNLEAGMYTSKQSFFVDAALCFDNARTFHKNNPDSVWIIKMAEQMKKGLDKERKRAEKKYSGGGDSGKKPKLKLSLNKGSEKTNTKAAALIATKTVQDEVAKKPKGSQSSPKVKLSLKIKPAPAPSATAPVPAPVPEFSVGTAVDPAAAAKTPAAKVKKPKFRLKLSTKKNAPPPVDTSLPKSTAVGITPKASSTTTTIEASTLAATPKASSTIATPKASSTAATPKTSSTTSAKKSTSKKESAKKSTSTPKSAASGSSRGKELPSAVAEKKAAKKAESKKTASAKKVAAAAPTATASKTPAIKISTKTVSTSKASGQIKLKVKSSKIKLTLGGPGKIEMGDGSMIPNIKAQCYKVISALKRKEHLEIRWFQKPVDDPAVLDDYKAKIKNPMDLATLTSKLDKNTHSHVSEFVTDLRNVFGNCLRFNALAGDSFRPVAVSMSDTSEELMHLFIQQHSAKPLYHKLLHCWKMCVQILDQALSLKNPDDGFPTIHYFLHPVSFFFGGAFPPDYFEKVKTPMDFGTITSKLMDGTYQKVSAFASDCRLVTANCKAFYHGKPEGAVFVGQATRLEQFLSQQIEALERYDSQQGADAKLLVQNPPVTDLLKPRKDFMTSLISFLRDLMYTDSTTKVAESACTFFERPVDVTMFSDYLKYVKVPMDVSTIEKNIEAGLYVYAEDFECEVNLIFKNCEAYNTPKGNRHMVRLAKYCAKTFRKQYSARIKAYDASGGSSFVVEEKKGTKRPLIVAEPSIAPPMAAPPAKKMRKSPVNVPVVAKPKAPKKALPRIIIRTDGPFPLHVAIAKIKQDFPTRRPHKDLDYWEGACSRFFRELKKHPWISSSKRFVFDAPVPLLHPEIKEAYAAKIRNPMDLTTAECKLLQGEIYQGPQEFVDDIARVFANAVTFNQSGHEEGDPTSCAYYDASQHLLRYARWLSLESISPFLVDDSQSEGSKQAGPIPQWKLSTSNHSDARKEMEEIVMKHSFDRSDKGDRYTWMETECEKLLKSLRHQSDHKRMQFFLLPNYPADYFGYIPHPMDWETSYGRFREKQYETFGEIARDLRLIFSNALKYNGRMKDVDSVSKKAYDDAVTMSEKLEAAIQRMVITVSDRVEREKVEQVVLDREMEIAQKEEDERVRQEWQQERERGGPIAPGAPKGDSSTIKVVRRPIVRKGLDFDFPFYDEEGTHEQSAVEVSSNQKKMYEEQQVERIRTDRATQYLGYAVHHKLQERSFAIHWAKQLTEKIQLNLSQKQNIINGKPGSDDNGGSKEGLQNNDTASFVASLLEKSDRSQIKLSISTSCKQKKRKHRTRIFFD